MTRSPRTQLGSLREWFCYGRPLLLGRGKGGKLYVQGVSGKGLWDSQRLVHWPEQAVDRILKPLAGDRKVRTKEELEEIVRVSERGLPAIKVWIHESLESVVRAIHSAS